MPAFSEHPQHVLDLGGLGQQSALAESLQRPLVTRLLGEHVGALVFRGGDGGPQPLDEGTGVRVRNDLLDAEQRGQARLRGQRIADGGSLPVRGLGLVRGRQGGVGGAMRGRALRVGGLPGPAQPGERFRRGRERRGRIPLVDLGLGGRGGDVRIGVGAGAQQSRRHRGRDPFPDRFQGGPRGVGRRRVSGGLLRPLELPVAGSARPRLRGRDLDRRRGTGRFGLREGGP